MKNYTKKLVLEDGSQFYGYGFGADRQAVCELVFNTSVVGYQEILSDPSYAGQMVVMTYPLIGNYGITDEDFETKVPYIGGMIVRENNDLPSNFRYTKTFGEVLEENGITAMSGVDTRMITKKLSREGSMKAALVDAEMSVEEALKLIEGSENDKDLIKKVCCRKRWFSRTPHHKFDVVALDCGIKYSIIRRLNAWGCNVTIVPYNTSADEILSFNPDGVMIPNGPGNPQDVPEVVDTVKALVGKVPMFGIGLGMQLISLAYGAESYKLKGGHRGGSPVKRLADGKLEMTSQNHSYAVAEESLAQTRLTVTHRNLLDGSVEGVECVEDKVFAVQYHPESAPGPQDSLYLFDKFTQNMK